MSTSSRTPLFTVGDDNDDDCETEFSPPVDLSATLQDLDDLPPELRAALLATTPDAARHVPKAAPAPVRREPLQPPSKASPQQRQPQPPPSQQQPAKKGSWLTSLFSNGPAGDDDSGESEGESESESDEAEYVAPRAKPAGAPAKVSGAVAAPSSPATTKSKEPETPPPPPKTPASTWMGGLWGGRGASEPATSPAKSTVAPAVAGAQPTSNNNSNNNNTNTNANNTNNNANRQQPVLSRDSGSVSTSTSASTSDDEGSAEHADPVPESWLATITTTIGSRVAALESRAKGKADGLLKSTLCSWCFHTAAAQRLVESKWLIRAHYQCEECARLTTPCFGCKGGMARCYGETSDTMCFRCTGLFERVAGDVSKLVVHGHKCSWCRTTHGQVLYRTASTASETDGRDLYMCEGCTSLTLKCGKCENFSRGHELWRDRLCVVCDGTFKDWNGALHTWVGRMGWCSWCITQGKHELAQRGLVFRSTYRCLSCHNPVVECRRCKTEMACAADGTCASCLRSKPWAELQKEKQRAFDAANWSMSKGMEEMARPSREKRLAWAQGHMRSFLYLVSMRPALRSQCATSLGVPILGTDFFGDSHREAWAIISTAAHGLAAQSAVSQRHLLATVTLTSQPTWYDVLRRLLDRTQFPGKRQIVLAPPKIMAACRVPDDPAIAQLEKEALARIGRFCLETGRLDNVDFGREDKEGLHLVLGHYLDALRGGEDDRSVLLYAWKVVLTRRAQSKEERIPTSAGGRVSASPAAAASASSATATGKAVKPFPVPLDAVPLFNAVAILLNQRVVLASEGVSLEDFYHSVTEGAGTAEGSGGSTNNGSATNNNNNNSGSNGASSAEQ